LGEGTKAAGLVRIAGVAAVFTSENVGIIIASNTFASGHEFWIRFQMIFAQFFTVLFGCLGVDALCGGGRER
jgi:hypothetical protein